MRVTSHSLRFLKRPIVQQGGSWATYTKWTKMQPRAPHSGWGSWVPGGEGQWWLGTWGLSAPEGLCEDVTPQEAAHGEETGEAHSACYVASEAPREACQSWWHSRGKALGVAQVEAWQWRGDTDLGHIFTEEDWMKADCGRVKRGWRPRGLSSLLARRHCTQAGGLGNEDRVREWQSVT